MKKIISIVLIISFIFALASCGGSPAVNEPKVNEPKEVEKSENMKKIDEFEAFIDEYTEFLGNYNKKSTLEQLADTAKYIKMIGDYAAKIVDFSTLEFSLNAEDAAYYAAAVARINKKLADIGEKAIDSEESEESEKEEKQEAAKETPTAAPTEVPKSTPKPSSDENLKVSDKLKTSCDNFEAFVDELVAFVQKYENEDSAAQVADAFKYSEYTVNLGLKITGFQMEGLFLSGDNKKYYDMVYERVNDKLRPYNLSFDGKTENDAQ